MQKYNLLLNSLSNYSKIERGAKTHTCKSVRVLQHIAKIISTWFKHSFNLRSLAFFSIIRRLRNIMRDREAFENKL